MFWIILGYIVKFEAKLGCTRPCFKKRKRKRKKGEGRKGRRMRNPGSIGADKDHTDGKAKTFALLTPLTGPFARELGCTSRRKADLPVFSKKAPGGLQPFALSPPLMGTALSCPVIARMGLKRGEAGGAPLPSGNPHLQPLLRAKTGLCVKCDFTH